jgi:hypothetical protein
MISLENKYIETWKTKNGVMYKYQYSQPFVYKAQFFKGENILRFYGSRLCKVTKEKVDKCTLDHYINMATNPHLYILGNKFISIDYNLNIPRVVK